MCLLHTTVKNGQTKLPCCSPCVLRCFKGVLASLEYLYFSGALASQTAFKGRFSKSDCIFRALKQVTLHCFSKSETVGISLTLAPACLWRAYMAEGHVHLIGHAARGRLRVVYLAPELSSLEAGPKSVENNACRNDYATIS